MRISDWSSDVCSSDLTHDLGRIDDARLHQVFIFAGGGVEAPVVVAAFQKLAHDEGAVLARIVGDLPRRRAQSPPDDVDAGLLVVVGRLETVECLQRAEQSDAAARPDAFLDRGARGVERVIDTILLFLDLDFGRTRSEENTTELQS